MLNLSCGYSSIADVRLVHDSTVQYRVLRREEQSSHTFLGIVLQNLEVMPQRHFSCAIVNT